MIIGLHGKPGVGKDTIADYLVEKHGFVKLAFADSLREEAAEAWGVDINVFHDRGLKDADNYDLAVICCDDYEFIRWYEDKHIPRYSPDDSALHESRTPRWVLCTWSDYQKYLFGDDIYVKRLVDKWVEIPDTTSTVITDVRYANEAEWLNNVEVLSPDKMRSINFGTIEVVNINTPQPTSNHSSNTPLNEKYLSNLVIVNNGSIESLQYMVDSVVELLKVS